MITVNTEWVIQLWLDGMICIGHVYSLYNHTIITANSHLFVIYIGLIHIEADHAR